MAGDDIAMNQFQVVTDAPYIYVELADGSQGKIKKSDLAEVIRAAMPIATQTMNGLMSANNIIYKGNVGKDNLENVGSSFGYAYGDGDGSGISGPFLSLKAESIFQIKSSFAAGTLKFRTYNMQTKEWSSWKSIHFT